MKNRDLPQTHQYANYILTFNAYSSSPTHT